MHNARIFAKNPSVEGRLSSLAVPACSDSEFCRGSWGKFAEVQVFLSLLSFDEVVSRTGLAGDLLGRWLLSF